MWKVCDVCCYIHDVYHFDNPISVAIKCIGESILRVNHISPKKVMYNEYHSMQ